MDAGKEDRMKEYIFVVNEKTPDAIGLSVGQIRRHSKELITCKDCKYSKFVDWGMNDCTHPQGLKGIAYSNSYCDRAERKERED